MKSPTILDRKKNSDFCIICPKHGPLVDLKRHCHNVVRFYNCIDPYETGDPIASWFQIASGINDVNYVSDLFDDTVVWCGPAIEYENKRSEFHSKLVRELARFNFIWGGFESLVDSLSLPSLPEGRDGKIRRVNHFLKCNYDGIYPHLKYYDEIVEFFKKILHQNGLYGKINELFSEEKYVSKKLIGLKVVYKIRNAFAHGAFRFPEPVGWGCERPYDMHIIVTSSRIVLMTIQMLLLSTTKNLDFIVSRLHHAPDEGVKAKAFILRMHEGKYRYS